MATAEETLPKTINFMKTIYLNKDSKCTKPCVATIGFFDGVHRGHQYLIARLIEKARQEGLEATVITFDKHPREVLHADYQPLLLNTFEEKELLLSKTGIDNCAVLPFSVEMAGYSARDFMQKVLKERLQVRILYIGYDNRFGHNREETFDDYVRYGKEMGITVVRNDEFKAESTESENTCPPKISSSQIRKYLLNGDAEMAEQCLGYPYFLWGTVVDGVQKGRELGFPTANIAVNDPRKLIPAPGVYAVNACLKTETMLRPSMMNIGRRPTFGDNALSLEVHILDYSSNLYGQQLAVGFVRRMREEHRFDSEQELAAQLQSDAREVRDLFSTPDNDK